MVKFTSKMQNNSIIILKAIALTAPLVLALCALVEYGIADYQARASEHQALLEQARSYKSHPLVVNGCDTDLQCEKLDYMLTVINASYE